MVNEQMNWRIDTGDALDLIPTLQDGSVQLVVTSPPYPGQYGNKMGVPMYLDWSRHWLRLLRPKLTSTGVVAINVHFKRTDDGWFDDRLFEFSRPAFTGLNLLDMYVYGKGNPPPNGGLDYCDPPGWEAIFVLTRAERPQDVLFTPVRRPYARGSVRKTGPQAGTLYSNRSKRTTEPHPDGARQTTLMLMSMSADQGRPRAKGISFPRALAHRFICQYTRPGDLVIDTFCGAGTVGHMAILLERPFIGFDNNPDEAERARAWLAETAEGASLEVA